MKQELRINDDSLNLDSNTAPSLILNNSIKNKSKDIFIDF